MNKKRKVTKRIAVWLMCLAMVLTTVNLPAFTTEVKAAECDGTNHNFSVNGTCVCGLTQVTYEVIEGTKTVRITGPNTDLDMTGDLVIPSTVKINGEDYSVTEIKGEAFEDAPFTGKLTIGNNVTIIRYKAFSGCRFTGDLTIPDSVTTIEGYAFFSGEFTGDLTIGNSVTLIAEYAFCYCDFTGNLTIGNRVKTIGSNAFNECKFTGDLIIPNSVTTIDDNAFLYGEFIGNVTIPDSVTTIGNSIFTYCSKITSISIPCADFPSIYWGDQESKITQRSHDFSKSEYIQVDGNMHKQQCKYCDAYSTPESCKDSLVPVAKVDATCEKAGNIAYYVCDKCGVYFSDAEATTVITAEDLVIAATKHTLSKVDKVDAKCTTAGCKEYWKCTNAGCGKIFADKDGNTETTLLDLAIVAKGHTWNADYTVDVEATTTKEGSKSIHCGICGAIKEGSTVTIPKKEAQNPTQAPTTDPSDSPTDKPSGTPSSTVAPTASPTPAAMVKPAKVKIASAKNNKKKTITVKIKNAKNAKSYKIQYATDKKFKKAKTENSTNLTVTLKGLKKKKTYYIRVCGVNGKVVGAWSSVKKVKVKK